MHVAHSQQWPGIKAPAGLDIRVAYTVTQFIEYIQTADGDFLYEYRKNDPKGTPPPITLADLFFNGFCGETKLGYLYCTDYTMALQVFIVIIEMYHNGQLELWFSLDGERRDYNIVGITRVGSLGDVVHPMVMDGREWSWRQQLLLADRDEPNDDEQGLYDDHPPLCIPQPSIYSR